MPVPKWCHAASLKQMPGVSLDCSCVSALGTLQLRIAELCFVPFLPVLRMVLRVGGFPIMTVVGLLSTIAIAAGIAQYMGFIELRPGVVASVHGSSRGNSVPILGSNGKIIGYGSRDSLGSGESDALSPLSLCWLFITLNSCFAFDGYAVGDCLAQNRWCSAHPLLHDQNVGG